MFTTILERVQILEVKIMDPCSLLATVYIIHMMRIFSFLTFILDCGIAVSEFVLQSRNYVHFRAKV